MPASLHSKAEALPGLEPSAQVTVLAARKLQEGFLLVPAASDVPDVTG
jgi:hypothetical protein